MYNFRTRRNNKHHPVQVYLFYKGRTRSIERGNQLIGCHIAYTVNLILEKYLEFSGPLIVLLCQKYPQVNAFVRILILPFYKYAFVTVMFFFLYDHSLFT